VKNNFKLISNGKRKNLLRADGSLLFEEWYQYIKIMDDYILVQKKDGWWNLANSDGTLISNQWLTEIYPSVDGIRTIIAVNEYGNYVKSGKLLLDTWAYDFDLEWAEGCAAVQFEEDGLWYFIKGDGTLLFEQGFEDAWSFSCGWAGVKVENGLFNFVDKKQKYMFDKPVFKIESFNSFNNQAYVTFEKDGEGCWIDTTGKIVPIS